MRVRLLGTGASDGWPDPWCRCASCAAAVEQGVLRGQTGALVDDRLLLDLGPELPRAALRQGTSLASVEAVLVTHEHEDHCAPANLMWRTWQSSPGPLQVIGPPAVLARLDGRTDATLTPAPDHGTVTEVAGYQVRALPAAHVPGAVLYDIERDGQRLLYATDTGVLPDTTVALARGRAYDLVLLELTGSGSTSHLDLVTWPAQVARLREVGAIVPATRVVATHLGHANPPPDVLDALLASWGASAGRDGQVVDLAAPRTRRVLVLGGARSGKSAYAEGLLDCDVDGGDDVTYVATAPERPGDDEWSARVAAHRLRRRPGWTTLETADVAGVLRTATAPVLVDDLGLWLTRVLEGSWDSPEQVFTAGLTELLDAWRDCRTTAVLVSPEVGSGVHPEHRSGRLFRDLLGTTNAALAAVSDEVVQVTAGIPRRLV